MSTYYLMVQRVQGVVLRYLAQTSAVAVLVLTSLVPTVSVASTICDNVIQELASTTEVFGSNPQSRKYEIAMQQQADQIKTTKRDMKQLGCSQGSMIVFGGANGVMCEKLTTALSSMQQNMDHLAQKHATLSVSSGDDTRRQQLMQVYDSHHCGQDVSEAEASVQTISAMTGDANDITSFETNPEPADATERAEAKPQPEAEQTYQIVPLGSAANDGSLKTLCVRTCDGAFFPISQGASPRDFRRDARVCSMMCPGTETELFYNQNASDKAEDMVSTATGQPYSEMPKAFAYKINPGSGGAKCGCNFSAYYKEMMRRETELTKRSTPEGTAPMSVASSEIRTQLSTPSPVPYVKPVRRADGVIPKVRQVGPAFLQDESAAIDLKHTGKTAKN